MRVVAQVQRSPQSRMDCDRPLRVVCRDCDHIAHWRCNVSSERLCVQCAERTRQRVARLVDLGATSRINSKLGHTYFLTLTAPGVSAGHLRWYQGRRPQHRTECGCERVWEQRDLAQWNADESASWNRLRTALSRLQKVEFFGSVEVQTRGALHRHIVLWSPVPLAHAEVQREALEAGYGCVLDLQVLESAKSVSRYLAKYVTKSSGDRDRVPWIRDRVHKPSGLVYASRRPTFRTWSASAGWGYTMKGLRAEMRQQARQRALYLRELAELLGVDVAELASPLQGAAEVANGDPPVP